MRKGRIRNFKQQSVLKLAVYSGLASLLTLSCSSNSFEGNIVAVEMQGDVHAAHVQVPNLIAIDPG